MLSAEGKVALMDTGAQLLVLAPFVWWIVGCIGLVVLCRKGYGRTTMASVVRAGLTCAFGGPITLLVALFRPSLRTPPPLYIDGTVTLADVAHFRQQQAMREELRRQGLDV
jgi:hypothetical protein